jgi:hypothetical protein
VLASGELRDFFELSVPGFRVLLTSLVGSGLAISFLWITHERFVPDLRFSPKGRG